MVGCEQNVDVTSPNTVGIGDVEAKIDSLAVLVTSLKAERDFLWSQRNAYRKITLCYGQWFQDNRLPGNLTRPDCHANY